MYLNIEVETFEENGKKVVYLSNDGSSGCKYEYKTTLELKQIVKHYVSDLVGYYAEDENNFEGTGMSEDEIRNLTREEMEELGIE